MLHMQEFQTLQKIDNIMLELKKEIDLAVPKILKIRSSKLLKREYRKSANSQIFEDRINLPKNDAQKDICFRKNGFLYRDVPIEKPEESESSRANVTRKGHSFVLRLSANTENSEEENFSSFSDDVDYASVKNKSHELFKNICEKKLDLIVNNVSEILRLCNECQLASERIANERNNRYNNSYLSHFTPHYIQLTVLPPISIFYCF